MIRLLDQHYLNDMLEIAKLKNRHGGTVPINESQLIELYRKYTENDDKHYCYGYFENDELISYIGFGLHENNKRGKFWYVVFLNTKKFHNTFSFNNIDMFSLLTKGFEIAESRGHYDYYYTVANRLERVYESRWAKNKTIPTGRYDLITLDIVPANTISETELYRKLLGETTKPDDMVIKKRVLRPEFRKV